MEGADESTEPWRHPSFCYHKQNVSANLDQIKVENFGFFTEIYLPILYYGLFD